MPNYDAIVIGCGGVGSAAVHQLAKRGLRVLGLEQFEFVHDRGSSHGHVRAIRQAYFEHPSYVPLLKRAYELWDELQKTSETDLFHRVGLIEFGPPDGEVVPGVLAAAAEHDLLVESLTTTEAQSRFPQFQVPAQSSQDYVAVFEPDAGYLHVEECVRQQLRLARTSGADLLDEQHVTLWQADGNSVTVKTDQDTYSAASLIIASGAWSPQVLHDLDIPFRLLRKHQHWMQTSGELMTVASGCPVYLFELPTGVFYGFPELERGQAKVAEHTGGEVLTDPESQYQSPDISVRNNVASFVQECLPALTTEELKHSACMYTMTSDSHFVVDTHPEHSNVCFAAGLSGHGFKFTSVLGEALADVATDGKTGLPIDFLQASRFS